MYFFVYDMLLSLNGFFFVVVDYFYYEVLVRYFFGDIGKVREILVGNIFFIGM